MKLISYVNIRDLQSSQTKSGRMSIAQPQHYLQ
jgi:hypothetical protein